MELFHRTRFRISEPYKVALDNVIRIYIEQKYLVLQSFYKDFVFCWHLGTRLSFF